MAGRPRFDSDRIARLRRRALAALRRRPGRHRRRRSRLAALAVAFALLVASGFVTGSVFYASVDLPEALDEALSQSSTVYYSDGTTVMAELAAEQRTSVDLDAIADALEQAVVAAEDANFYDHPGVDAKGVLRALVNNAKGGDQQGASTLTQQYVGLVADIRGDGSYLRKAREAAMAVKMEQEYDKDEILNHFLNIVYFGRGAYGAEAAARTFFGCSAADLSTSQAALLVAQIKSPDGPYDPRDPYDQGGNVEDATERWAYVLDAMVDTGGLGRAERDALTELPETLDPTDDPEGLGPEGHVANGFVLAELADAGLSTEAVMRGGLTIVTTVDAELQHLLDGSGIRDVPADHDGFAAAAAAVEPGTGRVLAYYGGEDGAGLDLAADIGHRPGTAFSPVVAVAAHDAGIDLWADTFDGTSPQTFDSYTGQDGEPLELHNTGGASVPETTLGQALIDKLDTPVYAASERIGAAPIAATAAALGARALWDPHDVDENGVAARVDPADPGRDLHPDLGIGAYPVTVLDAASMYAALAAGGTAAEPHFVDHVLGDEGAVHRSSPAVTEAAVDPAAALDAAVPLYAGGFAHGGGVAVNASATWHAGFTSGLALAVWAGDETKEGDGSSPEGTVAEALWWTVMDARPGRYDDDRDAAGMPLEEEEEAKARDAGSGPGGN